MDVQTVTTDLQSVVAQASGVKDSASKLVDGLAQLFHDAMNEGEQAVRDLVNTIRSKSGALAQAVENNP